MTTLLTQKIMRRVYAVYVLRRLFSPIVLKSVIIVASLILIEFGTAVSVRHVILNFGSVNNLGTLQQFLTSAFAHTRALVQLLVVVAFSSLLFLARDIIIRGSHAVFSRRAVAV